MEVRVSSVVGSTTAVVREPFDPTTFGGRIIPMLDRVYAFLARSAVRQVGQNIALYVDGDVEAGVEVRRVEPVRASLEQRFLEITTRLGVHDER